LSWKSNLRNGSLFREMVGLRMYGELLEAKIGLEGLLVDCNSKRRAIIQKIHAAADPDKRASSFTSAVLKESLDEIYLANTTAGLREHIEEGYRLLAWDEVSLREYATYVVGKRNELPFLLDPYSKRSYFSRIFSAAVTTFATSIFGGGLGGVIAISYDVSAIGTISLIAAGSVLAGGVSTQRWLARYTKQLKYERTDEHYVRSVQKYFKK